MVKITTVRTNLVGFGLFLLHLHLTNGTVNVIESGTPHIGKPFTMTCTITTFTGTATWAQDGTTHSTCGSTFCIPLSTGNYTFTFSAISLSVTIDPVSNSDQGTWQCTHASGSDSYVFNPQNFIERLIAIFITLWKAIGLSNGPAGGLILITLIILLILRWWKNKTDLNRCAGKLIITVDPGFGEDAKLYFKNRHISAVRLRKEDSVLLNNKGTCNNKVKIRCNFDEEHFSLTICEVQKLDYGVYYCDVIMEMFYESEKVFVKQTVVSSTEGRIREISRNPEPLCFDIFKDKEIQNYPGIQIWKDTNMTPEPNTNPLDGLGDPGKEIIFIVQFQVNNEDLVNIRNRRDYIFADKCTSFGVTFTGIQLILVAAINQLVALITIWIALPVVYSTYGKYDIKTVVPACSALAAVVYLLGIGVYLLIVICCRRRSNGYPVNLTKETPRCSKTLFLFVIIILPVAWIFLTVIKIFNCCKELRGDREENEDVQIEIITRENGCDFLCCTNSINPVKQINGKNEEKLELNDGDFLKQVPEGRRLPPIKKTAGKKKKAKKENKEIQKSKYPENDPTETAEHSEIRKSDSNIEQVNSNTSEHIDDDQNN